VKYYINSVPCENPVDRRKVWRKLGVLTEAVPSKVVAPFLSIVVVEIERKIWNSVTLLSIVRPLAKDTDALKTVIILR
jgi:hypothetical protein